jgi:integrase
LLPFFQNLELAAINQESCDKYRQAKLNLNPKTIHNHLTLLLSILNSAVDMGYLLKCPKIKKPKINVFSAEYKYLRTVGEIERFLSEARKFSNLHHDLYLTAILTGLRKGELVGLKWSDIDFEKRIIVVQRSFNKPTKNGSIRYVPILDQLNHILLERKLRCSYEYVFSLNNTNMIPQWHRIFEADFKQILDNSHLPDRTTTDGSVEKYIVFHSLRHTFASHWIMNSGDIFKLQKILGHSSIQMTMRYAHLSPHAFASDLNRLAEIGKITEGSGAQLLSINART